MIDVHLRGAFNVTQPAWRHMREQGYGRIVSTSSAAGIFGNFGQANYGAAKMGLVGFTRVLAVEGAKYNIKANAIAPLALTRMTEDLLGALGQKLQPEMVSPLVAFLAHEDCPVSGQVFSVGGGRVAEVFIGETQGYFNANLSMEDVRDNWGTITDREGYSVPQNLADETAMFLPFLELAAPPGTDNNNRNDGPRDTLIAHEGGPDVEVSEPPNSPESGRNGPNIALILGGVVVVLTPDLPPEEQRESRSTSCSSPRPPPSGGRS